MQWGLHILFDLVKYTLLLSKIRTHYPDPITWSVLINRSTQSLNWVVSHLIVSVLFPFYRLHPLQSFIKQPNSMVNCCELHPFYVIQRSHLFMTRFNYYFCTGLELLNDLIFSGTVTGNIHFEVGMLLQKTKNITYHSLESTTIHSLQSYYPSTSLTLSQIRFF